MKLGIPPNIFTAIFALSLSDELKKNIITKPSSMISKDLEGGELDAAIIPALDLLSHKDFLVSNRTAISFDGDLSNSYLYFKPDINDFRSVHLAGDVSSNEAILAKILFSERYNSAVEITLESKDIDFQNNNYLLCGNENFEKLYFNKGISFSDEIAAMIDYPYTNYLLAAREESYINDLVKELNELDKFIEDNLDSFLERMKLEKNVSTFMSDGFNSVYYELTQNEIDGLSELLKLPYYHGLTEEITEIKFV